MDELGSVLVGLLPFPLELLTAVAVFAFPLEKRRRLSGKAALALLAAVGFMALFCGLHFALYRASLAGQSIAGWGRGVSSLLWCGLLFAQMALIVWAVCAVPFREALYCASCAYLIEHMAYCVRLLLAWLLPGVSTDPGTPLYFLAIGLVYLAGYVFFVRRMVRDRHYATTAVESLWLTVGVLFVVLIMSVMATDFGFEPLHGAYALLCGGFALVGQVRQQKQLSLQRELNMQQQLWLQRKAQLEMSRENIELINRKCHDLKHQVAALKHIGDPEKRAAVIDSLQSSVMIYDAVLKTGNEILDTVLTEKSLLCSQEGITLSCIADGGLLAFMDAVDLYTLFGNALDNAIEASRELPQAERMIDLQVRQKAGLILICVSNQFAGTRVLGEAGLPRTSKADAGYHGFGLKSIQSIAEKYGGVMTVSAEAGMFRLRVSIPGEG